MKDGDFTLHNYQDELDAAEDNSTLDEFTIEQTGDLVDVAGIPEADLKEEMDKLVVDEAQASGLESEDARENIEDRDEDSDEAR